MSIYFWEREKEYERGRGRERGRPRIRSRLQVLSCQHRALWRGSSSWTVRSWPELKLDAQLTEPRGKPIYLFIFNVCLFLRQRERQSMSGGGVVREGDTESAAGSGLWAVSTEPDGGAQTHKPWEHDLSPRWMLNQLSHPGAPFLLCLNVSW